MDFEHPRVIIAIIRKQKKLDYHYIAICKT